ncbi:MAG TPA: hypothetical protein VKZ59_00190 [Acidobacteriota bacterium]|nr:hypothetical protein [Acidobacteriota bacterium]
MRQEKGAALLFVLLVTVLLSVLGLSLAISSITDYTVSTEYENHKKALMLADSAFDLVRNSLRGSDLSTLLASTTAVPYYSQLSASLNDAYRNPLLPLEARSIDFANSPASAGTRTVKGFLTPPQGAELGTGRFFAKLSDNEGFATEDGDPETDSDDIVYLRVMGIQPGPPSELSSYDSTIKNSVAIIEGLLKRDLSFNLGAPLTFVGPDVNSTFNGNSFDIVGDENHPGISFLNDDPDGGDATQAMQSLYDSLKHNQYDNIQGSNGGPYSGEPSIQDDTEAVRTSDEPDATNVLDANFLAQFAARIGFAADTVYPDGTHLSGGNVTLGTPESPEIVVAEGDLFLSGGGSGAGILVVQGHLQYQGAFDYDGLILVLGEGSVGMGGANKSITGGILVAHLIDNGDGTYSFGTSTFTLNGNSNFYFDSTSIRMAMNLLPMKTLMWREITPEIEPQLTTFTE